MRLFVANVLTVAQLKVGAIRTGGASWEALVKRDIVYFPPILHYMSTHREAANSQVHANGHSPVNGATESKAISCSLFSFSFYS